MTTTIKICTGRTCTEKFSSYILKRIEADKEFYQYYDDVTIEKCGCMGRCKEGPNISIDGEIFSGQNPSKTSELLKKRIEDWKKS